MHPWHDIDIGDEFPKIVNAIIEVPKGSKVKYELDKRSGYLRLDRILSSSVHYPANYGFIPKTLCEDRDALDILVLSQEVFVPLCLVRAKPIGVIKMLDQGESDDKIIAVHADDPEYTQINTLEDLSPHRIKEIMQFFKDYKTLENKPVIVELFHDAEIAKTIMKESVDLYKTVYPSDR